MTSGSPTPWPSTGASWSRTGSPYAVAPGTLRNKSGDPFQVFSPFHRTWLDHGVHDPAPGVRASGVDWLAAENRIEIPQADDDLIALAGESAARRAWQEWLRRDDGGVDDYQKLHDFPGADATSHLSIALRWGHLHPRTVLQDLAERRSNGALALARQIAWRDFFADVLLHRPDATTEPVKSEYKKMTVRRAGPDHDRGRAAQGLAGRPDRVSRWSTPGCGSSSPRAGCTTGSGWWWRRS